MDGTDEVWVAGKEETAIARAGVWAWQVGLWGFGLGLVSLRTEASVSLDNTPKLLGRSSLLK
jgi:hypothetical protein